MNSALLRPSNKRIPINTIFCLGQNYADHAKEMGSQAPSSPVIFLKPNSAVIEDGRDIVIPKLSQNIHHEVELTVLLGTGGKDIPKEKAIEHVAGYGVGLDMTMRDVQFEAKKAGQPWAVAKGFDTSAPLSPFLERSQIEDPHNLEIMLKVNGSVRQHSTTSNMIFRIETIIEFLSSVFTLSEGDIIFTGTPQGVGRVMPGDTIEASIGGIGMITHRVVSAH
ncbi:MAG: fumarylacetoacetate hydrolase family protein [Acidobacteriota bacterium]